MSVGFLFCSDNCTAKVKPERSPPPPPPPPPPHCLKICPGPAEEPPCREAAEVCELMHQLGTLSLAEDPCMYRVGSSGELKEVGVCKRAWRYLSDVNQDKSERGRELAKSVVDQTLVGGRLFTPTQSSYLLQELSTTARSIRRTYTGKCFAHEFKSQVEAATIFVRPYDFPHDLNVKLHDRFVLPLDIDVLAKHCSYFDHLRAFPSDEEGVKQADLRESFEGLPDAKLWMKFFRFLYSDCKRIDIKDVNEARALMVIADFMQCKILRDLSQDYLLRRLDRRSAQETLEGATTFNAPRLALASQRLVGSSSVDTKRLNVLMLAQEKVYANSSASRQLKIVSSEGTEHTFPTIDFCSKAPGLARYIRLHHGQEIAEFTDIDASTMNHFLSILSSERGEIPATLNVNELKSLFECAQRARNQEVQNSCFHHLMPEITKNPSFLPAGQTITSLDLSDWSDITDLELITILEHLDLRAITYLNLKECTEISSATLSSLLRHSRNLEELDLRSTRAFCRSLTTGLHALERLKKLNILFCRGADEEATIRMCSLCPNLRSFSFSSLCGDNYLYITGKTYESIFKMCPFLQDLDIGEAGMFDVDSARALVKYCPDVENFQIRGSMYSSTSMSAFIYLLSNLKHLKSLNIPKFGINRLAIEHLPEQMQWGVKSLSFSVTRRTRGSDASRIACRYPNLESLSIFGNYTYLRHLPRMGEGVNLREVKFDKFFFEEGALPAFAASNPLIKKMYLSGCHCTGDPNQLMAVAKSCPLIEDLELSYMKLISPDEAKAFTENCPNLFRLSLDTSRPISKETLLAFFQGSASYRSLNITNCINVDDEVIAAIASSSPQLEYLQMSGCNLVTNEAMKSLSERCHKLKVINISQCNKVTEEGAVLVVKSNPGLKRVNFLGKRATYSRDFFKAFYARCPRISQAAIPGMRSMLPLNRGRLMSMASEN